MNFIIIAIMLVTLVLMFIGYVGDAKIEKQKRRAHEWRVANNAYAPDSVMTDPEANR